VCLWECCCFLIPSYLLSERERHARVAKGKKNDDDVITSLLDDDEYEDTPKRKMKKRKKVVSAEDVAAAELASLEAGTITCCMLNWVLVHVTTCTCMLFCSTASMPSRAWRCQS
jgi:hypothetical protein